MVSMGKYDAYPTDEEMAVCLGVCALLALVAVLALPWLLTTT